MIYRIITTSGYVVGSTGSINYLKKSNNDFVKADSSTATAISYKGKLYNLAGHDNTECVSSVIIQTLTGDVPPSEQDMIDELLLTILEV